MLRRNLEVKARCAQLTATRAAVHRLGARSGGVELQTDTYFVVPKGRLKLREIQGQAPVLIAYDRPDRSEARLSTYHLVPVRDAAVLKAAFALTLSIRGEVHKRREIYLWRNVRIHLDEVANLGTFVELEAVLTSDEGAIEAPAHVTHLCQELMITPADQIAPSYAELLGL
ncbi:MAG TPA: class IV adenylate cyclase [Gemmataceae bacterium]|nr:class IV adenylate cyclase [Gemmataceae bacterium]